MSNAPLPAVTRILDEALARQGAERAAYLDAACGADRALREEVESLLKGQSRAATFLDAPPWGSDVATLEAGRRLGPYEILGLLGAGGMGAVYRARDTRLGRTVAVKVIAGVAAIHPATRERFAREARAIAALNHPHVCALHDIGHESDLTYLVMECVEGRTLADVLRAGAGRAAPFKVEEAVEHGIQIVEGLAAAHAAGIVHRDLKPSNIMLTPSGVKLLDFGLAKRVHEEAGPSDVTMTPTGPTAPGAVLGTVGYTSPEQARGEPVDARSDIFSLGCVLYEMLCGHQPFRRSSNAETTSALLRETPQAPSALNPAVPASCDAIVLRALEKDRELRYQSAVETRADLLRVRRELTTPMPHPLASPAARTPRLARWRTRFVLAAAIVLASAALAASLLSWSARRGGVPAFEPMQVTVGLGADSDPALSPDGNFLAYASDDGGNQDIWLLDLRSGSAVRRTTDLAADRRPAWLPNGAELLFVSEREGKPGVWRMPALDGPATMVLSDADDVAVSPDGQQIAFARLAPPGHARIATAPLSDPTRVRFLTGDRDGRWHHGQPAWSPDGREICYRAQMSLWTVSVTGAGATQVLASNHFLRSPTWSHDGRHIYFSSNREGPEAIWRVDVSGKNLLRVTAGTGPESQPAVDAAGSMLVFATRRDDFLLVLRDLASGHEETWSTSSYETMPALSPDGRTVFFQSNAVPPNTQLWSLALVGGRPAEKAVRLTSHDGTVSHPAVSPDGMRVAYSLVEQAGGRRSIWTIPSAGGQPTRMTEGPEDMVPEWTSDGRHLLFGRSEGGIEHIWQLPIVRGSRAPGRPIQLTRGTRNETGAVCAPDGSSIAFIRQGDLPGSSEVWVMRSDGGGEPRRITSGAQAGRVRWEPDGVEALLVTGRWGGAELEMRRVRVVDGTVSPLHPPVLFGPSVELVDFSLSRDRRLLAFARSRRQGNIWIARVRKGRF